MAFKKFDIAPELIPLFIMQHSFYLYLNYLSICIRMGYISPSSHVYHRGFLNRERGQEHVIFASFCTTNSDQT